MNFADQAFLEIFPSKKLPIISVEYSGRFNAFNAHVIKKNNNLTFKLSKKWRSISPEIKKGLVQELLTKLYKVKKRTLNMDLYESFTKVGSVDNGNINPCETCPFNFIVLIRNFLLLKNSYSCLSGITESTST